MALSASTVWEVRNVADYASASDTNGGGFVTGASGTDYSYASLPAAGAPKYSLSNGQTQGSTVILTASASADMIGNIAYISGGTGSVVGDWYQITNQSTGVSITVDRSTGLTAGTGTSIVIGGCLATPGMAAKIATVDGMLVWAKYSATAFTLTQNAVGSGGPAYCTGGVSFQGYDAARGDRTGNMPTITWPSSGLAVGSIPYIVQIYTSSPAFVRNIAVNGNSIATLSGFTTYCYAQSIVGCVANNCASNGFYMNPRVIESKAVGCGTGFYGYPCSDCVASTCTTGFFINGTTTSGQFNKCIAYNCTTGFYQYALVCNKCVADTCGHGFNGTTYSSVYDSCIASNCSTAGQVGFTAGSTDILINCASYNNTTELSGTPLVKIGFIPSASFTGGQPYVAAGSDFRPNATAGAGALLRGAGIGVFGQTDNVDIGAVQHTDPTGGGFAQTPMLMVIGA